MASSEQNTSARYSLERAGARHGDVAEVTFASGFSAKGVVNTKAHLGLCSAWFEIGKVLERGCTQHYTMSNEVVFENSRLIDKAVARSRLPNGVVICKGILSSNGTNRIRITKAVVRRVGKRTAKNLFSSKGKCATRDILQRTLS